LLLHFRFLVVLLFLISLAYHDIMEHSVNGVYGQAGKWHCFVFSIRFRPQILVYFIYMRSLPTFVVISCLIEKGDELKLRVLFSKQKSYSGLLIDI
jgi:hypothetical protein